MFYFLVEYVKLTIFIVAFAFFLAIAINVRGSLNLFRWTKSLSHFLFVNLSKKARAPKSEQKQQEKNI